MDGITDSIKDTIWKYLQLLLFSIIDNADDKSVFGATSELFENVNEEEFKTKMEDTMKDLFELFQQNQASDDNDDNNENTAGHSSDGSNGVNSGSDSSAPEFLNPENMQEHISSLLDGKLGKLATEIAEETAEELDLDMNDAENSQEAIKKLVSNPNKLMKLVKKVGGKLESKIKSGDIKESELMAEASQIMKKMKGMPGMNNMEKMFRNMGGMPGMSGGGMPDLSALSALAGKGAKINTGAYNNMVRKQEAIDKSRKKAQEVAQRRRKEKEAQDEMERKRQEYLQTTDHEAEIEKLMKSLEDSDEPVKKTSKKKKKKKAKQPTEGSAVEN